MTHTAFNQRLQQRRKARCLTQQEVADQLFVSRKTVSSWETGRNLPDLFMIQRLAAIYRTSVDDLLGTAARSVTRPVTMLGPALILSILLVSAAWNNLFAMDFGLQLVCLLTAVVLIIPVATAGGTWYRRQRNQQVRG